MSYKRHTRHTIDTSAPAETVHGLIADVSRWPLLFPPTIHAERIAGDASEERVRIWALVNGEAAGWTSDRRIDVDRLTVSFRQRAPRPPLTAMSGEWAVLPIPGGSRVVFTHDFTVEDEDPESVTRVERAVQRNSRTELESLRKAAESAERFGELLMEFSDSLMVEGSAAEAYEFIADCAEWPRRLPHVADLSLREEQPGVQFMRMATSTRDGTTHTTESVRVCQPQERVVYKQTEPPVLMSAHTGEWLFQDSAEGVRVTSRHAVLIEPSAVMRVLGPGTTVAEARAWLRDALGRNSMATLEAARTHVESANERERR